MSRNCRPGMIRAREGILLGDGFGPWSVVGWKTVRVKEFYWEMGSGRGLWLDEKLSSRYDTCAWRNPIGRSDRFVIFGWARNCRSSVIRAAGGCAKNSGWRNPSTITIIISFVSPITLLDKPEHPTTYPPTYIPTYLLYLPTYLPFPSSHRSDFLTNPNTTTPVALKSGRHIGVHDSPCVRYEVDTDTKLMISCKSVPDWKEWGIAWDFNGNLIFSCTERGGGYIYMPLQEKVI